MSGEGDYPFRSMWLWRRRTGKGNFSLLYPLGQTAETVEAFKTWAFPAAGGGGAISATATQTLPAFGQTSTATVRVASTSTQSLSFGQSADGAVVVNARSEDPLYGRIDSSLGWGRIDASGGPPIDYIPGQQISLGQTFTGTVGSSTISATASQELPALGQTATAAVRVSGSASQQLTLGQSATGGSNVTSITSALNQNKSVTGPRSPNGNITGPLNGNTQITKKIA